MRFIAIASVVCASREIEPKLIAPVANRFTIDAAGSTSSSGTGASANFSSIRPRIVSRRRLWSLMMSVNAVNSARELPRAACCSFATESGVQA